jgi:hypothetical protein
VKIVRLVENSSLSLASPPRSKVAELYGGWEEVLFLLSKNLVEERLLNLIFNLLILYVTVGVRIQKHPPDTDPFRV